MLTDAQISQQAKMLPIAEIAANLGIDDKYVIPYGRYKAKLDDSLFEKISHRRDGKLILVTAVNPTCAGEGKTTVSVGLGQGLCKIGKNAIVALREPSLGPVFGIKGGAAGGGYSQVLPMDEINLHFTGDLHAVTAANNLLCAMIDNHIHQGNTLGIDPRRITFKRCMDMNDRVLRNTVVGLGSAANGVPREDGFQITVASEVMAILCLSENLEDLQERLDNMLIGYTYSNEPVFAREIGVSGAAAMLLKDALCPNLVQTLEGTPALMHGGPFANIAHGCNSIRATKLALKLADYTVTEAGFGADLGAEKFFDIKCPAADIKPSCAVIVATVRALKHNGGVKKQDLGEENLTALSDGLINLKTHIENVEKFGVPVVVAINHFDSDTNDEITAIKNYCEQMGVTAVTTDAYISGGDGASELARAVCQTIEQNDGTLTFAPLYNYNTSVYEKMEKIATEIYRADGVELSQSAQKTITQIEKMGLSHLPICFAKTQYSLSDDQTKLGKPENFKIHVREIRVSSGAGFIVALTGNIMTMPGLPKEPAALKMKINQNGEYVGLF